MRMSLGRIECNQAWRTQVPEFITRRLGPLSAFAIWLALACAPAPQPPAPSRLPPFHEVAGPLDTLTGCWEIRTRALDPERSPAESVAVIRLDSVVLTAEDGWPPSFRAEPLQGLKPVEHWARWGPVRGDSILVMANYSQGWQFARVGEELQGQAVALSDLVQPPDSGVRVLGQAHASRVACPTGKA